MNEIKDDAMNSHYRLAPAVDLVLAAGFLILVNFATYKITTDYSGPITALSLLTLVTVVMRYRGLKWSDFGLVKTQGTLRLLGQVIFVLVGTIAVGVIVRKTAGLFLDAPETNQLRFEGMEGNLPMFLWWVAVGWAVGGFAEEMIFRGFFLNRFEAMMNTSKVSTILAVVFQASIFGLIHYYNRGALGAVTISAVGLTLGTFYITFGRSLWPLIIAHGTVDSLSFLEDFLGA